MTLLWEKNKLFVLALDTVERNKRELLKIQNSLIRKSKPIS